MKPKNKYVYHTHISEKDFRHLLQECVRDSTATETETSERIHIPRSFAAKGMVRACEFCGTPHMLASG